MEIRIKWDQYYIKKILLHLEGCKYDPYTIVNSLVSDHPWYRDSLCKVVDCAKDQQVDKPKTEIIN